MDDVRKYGEYQYMPFIINELVDKPGGGTLKIGDLDRSKGSIAPGFFVGETEAGLLQMIVGAVLFADAANNAVNYKVKKGHQVKVGMFLAGDAEGSKAYAVTKVVTTDAEFDTITLGTTLGVTLKAGKSLYEVKEEDEVGDAGELQIKPLGIAKNEIDLSVNHPVTGVSLAGYYTAATMAFGAPKAITKHLPMMQFKYPNV